MKFDGILIPIRNVLSREGPNSKRLTTDFGVVFVWLGSDVVVMLERFWVVLYWFEIGLVVLLGFANPGMVDTASSSWQDLHSAMWGCSGVVHALAASAALAHSLQWS